MFCASGLTFGEQIVELESRYMADVVVERLVVSVRWVGTE